MVRSLEVAWGFPAAKTSSPSRTPEVFHLR